MSAALVMLLCVYRHNVHYLPANQLQSECLYIPLSIIHLLSRYVGSLSLSIQHVGPHVNELSSILASSNSVRKSLCHIFSPPMGLPVTSVSLYSLSFVSLPSCSCVSLCSTYSDYFPVPVFTVFTVL